MDSETNKAWKVFDHAGCKPSDFRDMKPDDVFEVLWDFYHLEHGGYQPTDSDIWNAIDRLIMRD